MAIIGISVLIQVLFRFDGFFKKENLFNQVTFWVYFVANAKMMIASCIFLYDLDGNIPLYIIGVAFTIILFTLNTDILFIKENTPITVYVGIKVLILLLIIMMFLWATTCIIIGMKCKQKYLRIYALILALVSSVKLALLDISYSNTISRAFSLILCGFLCFIIVYIYGKLDKIEKKE